MPKPSYEPLVEHTLNLAEVTSNRFLYDGAPVSIYVDRVTGVVRMGCTKTTIRVLRKLLERVETAYKPVNTEIEI